MKAGEEEWVFYAFNTGSVVSQPCLLRFSSLGRLGYRVPRMEPNVEVNLRGLLGLGKDDLSGDEYGDQLGSSGA
ncbi:hypothetical protein Tco_0133255 [Tanacetum coccineum]